MTGNKYHELAARTINSAMPDVDKLRHAVFGITSEAGEIAGIMQKQYQGHEFDTQHIVKECGDLMWFVAELCTAIGISVDTVMEVNIEKLRKRYPDGFDAEHSLHREAGDI